MLRKPSTPSQDPIEAAAAAWLSERDDGFTANQSVAFERWRNAAPEHAAAIEMLEQTRNLLAQMPNLRSDPALRRRMEELRDAGPGSARLLRFPRVLKVVAALAACVAIGFGIFRFRSGPGEVAHEASYATKNDEYRQVVLPDQSVMELNGGTRVRVQYSGAQRRLSLESGEAHFSVRKNPARPFLVIAGNVGVRAVGTAFSVRRETAEVQVLVTDGRVQVGRKSDSSATQAGDNIAADAPVFGAGQQVVVATDPTAVFAPNVTTVAGAAQLQALAWRGPRLVFAETPLAQVVEEFNRHNRIQLEIGDVELREQPVGGTFRADAVESFVRLLEESGDISVERRSSERIVLRKASAAKPL
jgi:transmembrane sensor